MEDDIKFVLEKYGHHSARAGAVGTGIAALGYNTVRQHKINNMSDTDIVARAQAIQKLWYDRIVNKKNVDNISGGSVTKLNNMKINTRADAEEFKKLSTQILDASSEYDDATKSQFAKLLEVMPNKLSTWLFAGAAVGVGIKHLFSLITSAPRSAQPAQPAQPAQYGNNRNNPYS